MDVQLPDGTILQGIPDGTTRSEIADKLKASGRPVPAEWLREPSMAEKAVKKVVEHQKGEVETAAALATGAVATPIAGLAGIAQGVKNITAPVSGGLWEAGMPAADRVRQVQEGLTYQPKTEAGKRYTGAIGEALSYVGDKPGGAVGELATDAATKLGASPEVAGAIGATANTATQAAAQLLLAKGAGVAGKAVAAAVKPAARGAGAAAQTAAQTAETYARGLGIDWAAAPQTFKDALTNIAQQGTDLSKLPPEAVKRVARAERQGVTLTRGQATRDLGDLQSEENLRLAAAGKPLRERMAGQDTALHERLGAIRQEVAPGSKVGSTADVGTVQLAARRKLQAVKAAANDAYTEARKQGAFMTPVDPAPLLKWLEGSPARTRNVGWVARAVEDYAKPTGGKKITIQDMEDLRSEVSAAAGESGRKGFFAGQAKAVIDGILDRADSNVYQAARGKWKAYKDEFSAQKSVRDLTSELAGTTTRRIALEDTLKRVINGPTESLAEIRKSLTTGGTKRTQQLGRKAWADLQAGVIEHLREIAAGRRRVPGENQQLHFNAAFLDEFEKLNQSGKLDVLFGEKVAAKMRDFADTVRDTRTTPQQRIVGPSTANKFVKLMEDVGGFVLKLPGIKQVKEAVTETRNVRKAMETPVSEKVKPPRTISARERKLRQAAKPAAGAAVTTGAQTYQGDQ
jgi:hypothetical protein